MSGNKEIVVFPAAGKLGISFCSHLIGLVPPRQLILVSRHPEKIPEDWVDASAEARKADYDEPETLEGVFDGAAFKSHQRAVNAALQCSPGMEHIFYTSLAFGGNGLAESKAHVMQAHLKTEGWLKSLVESRPGLTYTSIREGMIYSNKIVVLTGPNDYSFNELAAILSRVAGKTISIEVVSPEQHSSDPAVVKVMGQDQGKAAAWTTVFEAIQAGETSTVNGGLERLLGQKAEDVETTIRESLVEDTWVRR